MDEWLGGKYKGFYKPYKENRYLCSLTHKGNKYTKVVDIEDDARKWLMEKSEEFGMVKNKYKILNDQVVVQIGDGSRTFICDLDDLKYVNEGVWGPKITKNESMYEIRMYKDKKVILFHEYIKPWGDGLKWDAIEHINGNRWDNRRSNLKEKKIIPISNKVAEDKHNDWEGGKYAGNYKKMKSGKFCSRLMYNRNSYCKTFETENEAKKWLMDKSEEFGIVKNKFRKTKTHIEVKLQDNRVFLCNIEDYKYIDSYVWSSKKDRYTYYVYGTISANKSTQFHRHIKPWGDGPEWKTVDHINGNGLDNRRSNLRDGSGNINNLNQTIRSDNISGIAGVHWSNYDNSWVVQWIENGKRRRKGFRVCDNSKENRKKNNYHKVSRTYEEAKHEAIKFRLKKDKELGYTNGRSPPNHKPIKKQ